MSLSKLQKLNFSLPISMDTAVPLDLNSVFTSVSAATAAANSAVEIGGYGSKNYIGQVITITDAENGTYKTYRIQSNGTLKELAAEYSFSDGITEGIDQYGNSVVKLDPTFYNRINVTFAILRSSSADWDKTYLHMKNASGWWQEASNAFSESSGKYESAYSTFSSVSSKWNASYTIVTNGNKRWTSAYNTLNSLSGKWEDDITALSEASGGWADTASAYASTSGENKSTYSTVTNASSRWDEGYSMSNRLMSVTPDEVWTGENQLADKGYVVSQTRNNASYFRGSFATWYDVPTTTDGYNSDITGSKTPSSNDYMVVRDYSSETMTVAVSSNPINEKLSEDVIVSGEKLFDKDHIITSADITVLTERGVTSVNVYCLGSWRFKYTGVWSVKQKSGWSAEYRLNNTALTEEQLAAINSGITREKTRQISKNEYDISIFSSASSDWNRAYSETEEMSARNRSVYSTVNETSSNWESVSGKVDNDFFRYYASSSWSILTQDDTNYTLVPSGLIFIYEEENDAPPIVVTDLSFYFKDTQTFMFSEHVAYDPDFETLYLGGNIQFNADTNTLTIPGSSDADGGTIFYPTNGLLQLSETVSWNSESGLLTLSNGDTYNSATSSLTINGHRDGGETRPMYTITYHLANAVSTNTRASIPKNEQYITTITANAGYVITSLTCLMGGVSIAKTGESSFIIDNVTGNIVITAVAVQEVVSTYSVTYNLTGCSSSNTATTVGKLSEYSTTITPNPGYTITSKQCFMGNTPQPWLAGSNSITIDSVIGDISISVMAMNTEPPTAVYYTSTEELVLAHNTTFENGVITLGNTASLTGGDTLVLEGASKYCPTVIYQITKNINGCTVDNPATTVEGGSSYSARVSISTEGYEYSELSCTMGGIPQTISANGEIYIAIVTGSIVITATARMRSLVEYNTSTNTLKLQSDAVYNNDSGMLTLGRNSFYDSTLSSVTFSGNTYTNSSTYDTASNFLTIGNNSEFTNNELKLGSNNTFTEETGLLRLGT